MKLGSFAHAVCLLSFAILAEGSRYIRTEKPGRLGSSLLSGSEIRESEALPGWLGDIYRPAEPTHEQQRNRRRKKPIQVSEHPRAYVWPGMLSEEEANHIIHLAAPHLKRSTVVGKHEEGVVDNIRTSYGTFVPRLTDATIERIERRIAAWTNTSLEQQEDIQVLRYVSGQKYGAHHDGLGRMATVVMFLVDTEEGGETIFPTGKWLDPKMAKSFENVSPCAKGHIGLRPRKGDALLFFDKHPDGTDDSDSIHTACPVIRGVKWSAPVWIHPQPFRAEELKKPRQMPKLDPGVCRDHHDNCESWAEAGECQNNPSYMTGEGGSDLGACRHACGICEPCELGDSQCYMQNRERAGFLNIQEEIARITAPLDDDSLFGHDEV